MESMFGKWISSSIAVYVVAFVAIAVVTDLRIAVACRIIRIAIWIDEVLGAFFYAETRGQLEEKRRPR